MSSSPPPRDAGQWAKPVDHLNVEAAPDGAVNLNVQGRQTMSPLQGFGQLWQKTYQIGLRGASVSPADVITVWKTRFPDFQPPENRFFPSVAGVKPGEVVLINAMTPGGMVSTGVRVMFSDDESFTLMTPQGHPEAGWITFSAFERDGVTVAQVQSLARANDPMYEVAFHVIGAKIQERIWHHVLTALGAHYQVREQVTMKKQCVDPRVQWSQVGNLRHNAQIHTLIYTVTKPLRRLAGRTTR
jgi:hypothetical protein